MRYASRDIFVRFRSVRDALAYAFSTSKGPRGTQSRWADTPRAYGDPWAGHVIRRILRGELGVTADSILWHHLEDVVLHKQPPTAKARSVMDRLRKIMGSLDLLDDQPTQTIEVGDLEDVIWTDPETGLEWQTVREMKTTVITE